jgi:hypothetical protein
MCPSINTFFTAKTHDCMDAGVRARHGAVAERTQRNSLTKTINPLSFRGRAWERVSKQQEELVISIPST